MQQGGDDAVHSAPGSPLEQNAEGPSSSLHSRGEAKIEALSVTTDHVQQSLNCACQPWKQRAEAVTHDRNRPQLAHNATSVTAS